MPALATARFEICERLNERALRLDRENDKGLQRWKRENIYIYNFSLISQILKYHFTYICGSEARLMKLNLKIRV